MEDLADPSDWLNTNIAQFSELENALHCDICKEFYDTPMITSCCHTFCSKCIRTCLSANGKCPSCQTSDQASKLRNNWVLQTIVDQFMTARPAALEVARREKKQVEESQKPGKRKRGVLDSDDVVQEGQDRRTTRSKSRRIAASQGSQSEAVEILDSDEDEEYRPEAEPDDGLVECLLGCGKRMKAEQMDAHLDRCEDEKKQASQAKSRTPLNSFGSRPSSAQNSKEPERISEMNYSFLNDTKMRQKLKDAGVPNWGSKQLMVKRHTEWVNLWNANCDSKGRRSKAELLRDLDAWERTQGGRAPNANGLSSTIMRKDFDGMGWASSNKQDFSRLIADAKRRKNNPASEEGQAKEVVEPEPEVDVPPDSSSPQNTSIERPYEDNPEAIAAIREKVEGHSIEPMMNAGFATNGMTEPMDSSAHPPEPPPGSDNAALLAQNHFGNGVDQNATASPVKMSMFGVPQRAFSDVDGGGDGVGDM